MTLEHIRVPFWELVRFFIEAGLASLIASLVLACIVGAIGACLFALLTVGLLVVGVAV